MTRYLTYSVDGHVSFGLVAGEGVIDLAPRFPGMGSLVDLVIHERLDEARQFEGEEPDHGLADVVFERVIPAGGKIVCIGVNYGGRSAEYTDSSDASYPSVFLRFVESLTGHRQSLLRPPESEQLDYEGEIVAVIGKSGRRIPIGEARAHIAGVTLGNEGTIRDWVRHAKFNVTQGKNWERSGSVGPWMVPIDEVPDFEDLQLITRVNGEVRQSDSPATMKYPIEYQVHYLSTFMTLEPGDLIFTGTPTGAGARHDPPKWLRPGDVVEVEVPGIGVLRNSIEDEFDPSDPMAELSAPEGR